MNHLWIIFNKQSTGLQDEWHCVIKLNLRPKENCPRRVVPPKSDLATLTWQKPRSIARKNRKLTTIALRSSVVSNDAWSPYDWHKCHPQGATSPIFRGPPNWQATPSVCRPLHPSYSRSAFWQHCLWLWECTRAPSFYTTNRWTLPNCTPISTTTSSLSFSSAHPIYCNSPIIIIKSYLT